MPFGNTGDQVGGPGQRQRTRKATDDRDDISFQPERNQGFIDRSLVETPTIPLDRRIYGFASMTQSSCSSIPLG
jgi:hypothetical protein